MIWWRGKGIWALLFVALIGVSADRIIGVRLGVPIGLACAVVLTFLLRNFWGEESSAFSVPVRFWPVGLAVFSAITFFQR